VVYKVGRLTRALTDFARIVEVLDARGASFVSVTQSLNSTTSMGRLTLNVSLSFAQFEREVTGERIRDKIAASKRKGIFIGGPVPIGYRVHERKLLIDEQEAATVRHIFIRYVELGSGRALVEELRVAGYRTKLRQVGDRVVGGIPFERGVLFHLLANPIYVGKVVHKDATHDGEHAAIIDDALWQNVQQRIADNRVNRGRTANSRDPSLLAGILRDGNGRQMTPSHAIKNGRRYRYYVRHSAELRPKFPPAWRMPAHDVEAALVARLSDYFRDYREIAVLAGSGASAVAIGVLVERAEHAVKHLAEPAKSRVIIAKLIRLIGMADEELRIELDRPALARLLGLAEPTDDAPLVLLAAATKVREGKATKLVLTDSGGQTSTRDPKLVALLSEARAMRDLVLASPDRSIREIAADQQRCRHRIAKLIRLSWLSPSIATAIVEGRQARALTPRKLLDTDWPLSWAAQDAMIA